MKKILLFISITMTLALFSFESNAGQRLPCYQSRRIPFNKEITYRAIKHMLVRSNFTIEHSEVEGDLISANGIFKIDDDSGKFIHVTILYEDIGNNVTLVTAAGTYSDLEERSEIVTVGAGSITLPIPLFFRKNVAVEKSGTIRDPNVFKVIYLNIYNALIETEVNSLGALVNLKKPESKPVSNNIPSTNVVKDVVAPSAIVNPIVKPVVLPVSAIKTDETKAVVSNSDPVEIIDQNKVTESEVTEVTTALVDTTKEIETASENIVETTAVKVLEEPTTIEPITTENIDVELIKSK